jgi:vancomycin resistance protein YoaR
MGIKLCLLSTGILLAVALAVFSSQHQTTPQTIGIYATSLADRTPNQRFNAHRAANLIDGSILLPGKIFSFNTTVGGWSEGKGYRRAPVSYNGVLIDEYGGGVCQTSSTVYNAALLSGLIIIERHHHTFAPGYVPPGRDAAVAYQNVDLRLLDPYAIPVVLHAAIVDSFLVCSFTAAKKPDVHFSIESKVLDTYAAPTAPVAPGAGFNRARWHLKGRDGVRVATTRDFYDSRNQLIRTELVSDNTYQAITAAIWPRIH